MQCIQKPKEKKTRHRFTSTAEFEAHNTKPTTQRSRDIPEAEDSPPFQFQPPETVLALKPEPFLQNPNCPVPLFDSATHPTAPCPRESTLPKTHRRISLPISHRLQARVTETGTDTWVGNVENFAESLSTTSTRRQATASRTARATTMTAIVARIGPKHLTIAAAAKASKAALEAEASAKALLRHVIDPRKHQI